MPLILAIEPDRRQAAQLSAVVRKRVQAELILVDTTERALDAIGNRMPDLVLVPALLSPQDDAALAAALRVIAAAARVQMLTIPVLGAPRPAITSGGMLSALRRKPRAAEPDGCDPAVFAEQIASYLERAAEERSGDPAEMPAEIPAADAPARDEFLWPAAQNRAPAIVDEAVNREWLQPLPEEVSGETSSAFEEAIAAQPVEHHDAFAATAIDDQVSDVIANVVPEVSADISREVSPYASPYVSDDVIHDAFAATPGEMAAAVTPVIDDESATGPDESVSLAVEEAVRALFADPPPAVFDPPPVIAAPVEALYQPDAVAVTNTPQAKDEWVAVEELIAALQLMPLAAIEITNEDDWIAPVSMAPSPAAETPAYSIDEPDSDVIDLTRTFGDSNSNSQALAVPSPAAATPAAKSEREWVALIESLRHDVERLRVERAEKPGAKTAPAKAARPDRQVKPAQDEWGFFDPQQCGFAALLAKLDEVTDSDDGRTNH